MSEVSDGTGDVETHLQGEVKVRLGRHKKRRNVVEAILLLMTKHPTSDHGVAPKKSETGAPEDC